MKILGLSSNYHDASAALVVNGQVVAAAAEERFTLQKHDPSFPLHSAQFCLEQAGLSIDDLDYIVYHEEPSVKFSRALSSAFVRFPFSLPTFIKSMREAITAGFWIKWDICRKLDADPRKVKFMPHHFSHAAHGFLTSSFDKAAILTLDAAGEWMCSGIFRGDRSRSGAAALEAVSVVPFPHSLGLVYSAFTGFLGFKVNDGECSTMALAAFGQPRFAEDVRKIIRTHADGTYDIDLSYFDFSRSDSLPITKKFTNIFGEPRPYRDAIEFDCFKDGSQELSADSMRYADIAASIQLVLEEHVLRMAQAAKDKVGGDTLCIAGGVALNCVAVNRVIESGLFKSVYVPPDPGDGGGAMGAALYAALLAEKNMPSMPGFHPYFGKEFSEKEILEMLPHLPGKKIQQRHFNQLHELTAATAQEIAAGKIVGWVQNRFENGPRALGNRSILMRPDRVDIAKRLSKAVKKRAAFRPYACSVLADDCAELFSQERSAKSAPARWMQTAVAVAEKHKKSLRASMHVDHTTRPHVCEESTNPRMYYLLQAWKKEFGVGALLNTSFNERGLPMVAAPAEALLMFLRTDMDVLVLGDTILTKET